MELIRSASGQVIARIQYDSYGDGCMVYSPTGQLLGICRDGFTKTAGGQVLAHGHHPMLLIQ